jgi:hypothetical protein
MKITILAYLEKENDKTIDPVVGQVARALRRQRHKVSILGVHGDVKKLISGLTRPKPDLVFNLMEMFGDNLLGASDVVGLLDLLDLAYTGGAPASITCRRTRSSPRSCWPSTASSVRTTRSSRRTPTWRPAAGCACRCSSSRCAWTPRSASAPSRWSTTPPT